MRKELKQIGDQERHTFTATFVRFGTKNGYKGIERTVLLKDVMLENKIVCDHLWFNLTKGFYECNLTEGDKVKFDGRITTYEKGYKGYREDVYCPIETDYKIERPTHVEVIERSPTYDDLSEPCPF